MFTRRCPHCSLPIDFLSPGWESQRQSPSRACPHCRKAVVVQFKANVFATWLLGLIALSAVAGYLFGSLACISLLVAAIPVTLFASLHVFRAP